MQILVDDVRDQFIDRYSDAQNTNNTKILALMQEADMWLSSILPYRHDTFDLTLTANDNDILFSAFPAGAGGHAGSEITRIYQAVYIRSANDGDYKELAGKDVMWMNKNYGPSWRLGIAGEPSIYSIDAGATGRVFYLAQKPNTTTSGGYPLVRVFASCHKVLTFGTSMVLAYDLPSAEPFLACMCEAWARVNDRPSVAGWRETKQKAANDARAYLYGYIEQDNASILPSFYPMGGIT
jgi:hypothetical protein